MIFIYNSPQIWRRFPLLSLLVWPTNLFGLPRNSIEDRGFLGLARDKSTQWNLLVQDRLDEAVFYDSKILGRGKSHAEKYVPKTKKNALKKSPAHAFQEIQVFSCLSPS